MRSGGCSQHSDPDSDRNSGEAETPADTIDPLDVLVCEPGGEKYSLRGTAALYARVERTRGLRVGVPLSATGARA